MTMRTGFFLFLILATATYPLTPRLRRASWATPARHLRRRFPSGSSNLIGATTMEQLKPKIDSVDPELSPEVLAAIEAVHRKTPNPCP